MMVVMIMIVIVAAGGISEQTNRCGSSHGGARVDRLNRPAVRVIGGHAARGHAGTNQQAEKERRTHQVSFRFHTLQTWEKPNYSTGFEKIFGHSDTLDFTARGKRQFPDELDAHRHLVA